MHSLLYDKVKFETIIINPQLALDYNSLNHIGQKLVNMKLKDDLLRKIRDLQTALQAEYENTSEDEMATQQKIKSKQKNINKHSNSFNSVERINSDWIKEYMMSSDLTCDEESIVLLSLNDSMSTKKMSKEFITLNLTANFNIDNFVLMKDYSPVIPVSYDKCPVVKSLQYLHSNI